MRYAGARHAGATEAKIAAINDESSELLSARERAALRFAEKLAVDLLVVHGQLLGEAKGRPLSRGQEIRGLVIDGRDPGFRRHPHAGPRHRAA